MTFVKGVSGNPKGRRTRVTEDMYREVIKSAVTPDRLFKITNMIASRAEAGDVAAFKVLLLYLAGNPMQPIELSGKGGTPLATEATHSLSTADKKWLIETALQLGLIK